MSKKVDYLQGIISTYFYTYPAFVLIAFGLVSWSGQWQHVGRLHTMVWIPAYLWFLRINAGRIRWNWLFMVLHMLVFLMIGMFLPVGKGEPYFMLVPLLIYQITFSMMVHRQKINLPRIALNGVLLQCIFLALLYMNTNVFEMRIYLIAVALGWVIVYFVEMHVVNVDETLKNAQDMLQQSVRITRQRNNRILAVLLVIMILCISIALLLRLDKSLGFVVNGFVLGMKGVMYWIFSGIKVGEKVSDEEQIMENDRKMEEVEEFEDLNGFWQWLDEASYIILGVILCLLVVYCVYIFIHRQRSQIKSERTLEEMYEETSLFMELRSKKNKQRYSLGGSEAQKVRRMYRKSVNRRIRQGIPVEMSDTAQEICGKIEQTAFEDMTEIFEKARYSTEVVTAEDVQRMKRYMQESKEQRSQ